MELPSQAGPGPEMSFGANLAMAPYSAERGEPSEGDESSDF
jgi:hypothetical protein